jgi:hypothetical protein
MNERNKKELLESVLKSEKILGAFEKYNSSYKLNKKLMIEKIIEELDTLWERYKDLNKLKKFLETFLSNHIKDFLIKLKPVIQNINKSESYSKSDSISLQKDIRVEIDPNERLQKELQERRKNTFIHLDKQTDEIEEDENFTNEENIEEKNDLFNVDNTMNNRNTQIQRQNQQINTQMLPQMGQLDPRMAQMAQMAQMQLDPQMNQMQLDAHMNQNQTQMQQLEPRMNQMNQMQQLDPRMTQMQQVNPRMTQMQQVNPRMNQMNQMNQMAQMQPQMNQMAQMQPQMNQMAQMQPQMNQMAQMQPQMNQMAQVEPRIPQMAQMSPQIQQQQLSPQMSQPLKSIMTNHLPDMNTNINKHYTKKVEFVKDIDEPPVNQEVISIDNSEVNETKESLDRSVIHIDSRERNLEKNIKCNPFSIDMNDNITCLISIRDMIISNSITDPYLLVQISEYKNSLYENQLNREVHYKMVRKNKDSQYSYYENTDLETMIRLRNINKITFNVIRPNGKLLYSFINDIIDISKINTEEELTEYLESHSMTESVDKTKLELIDISIDTLVVNDTLILFENELDKGSEVKILHIDKKNKKVLVEYTEPKLLSNYKKVMINKYQMSISLEII